MLHGTFDECQRDLIELNRRGAGVFVTVNETDLRGRMTQNVIKVRSFFVDSDDGQWPKFPVEPNIIVKSAGGNHGYWLADDTVLLEDFTPIQTALAITYGTDRKVKDLPRVMRIPGFIHQKRKPHVFVELLKAETDPQYSVADLIAFLDLSLDTPNGNNVVVAPPPKDVLEAPNRIDRCERYMEKVDPAVEGQSGDAHTLMVAMIGGDFGLSDSEFWPLFLRWNETCQPPWEDRDLERKLRNAHRYRKKPFGWRLAASRDGDDISRVRKISGPMAPDPYSDAPTRVVKKGFDEPPPDNFDWLDYYQKTEQERQAKLQDDGPYWERDDMPDPFEAELRELEAEEQKWSGGGNGGDGDGDGDGDGGTGAPGEPERGWEEKFKPMQGRPPENPTPVYVMAHQMKSQHRIVQDISKAMYYYVGDHWIEVSKEYLMGLAMTYDHVVYTKTARRSETVNFVLAHNQKEKIPWNAIKEYEIPMMDGVVNVIKGSKRKHRPTDWLDTRLPWQFDAKADCPMWRKCLIDWFGDEIDKRDALQEFFGYILLSGTAAYKKALFLKGESDTGKSLVAKVAQMMVGVENICQIRLEDMDDPKKRAPIKGKMLNIITELPEWGRIAESGFKMLVSTGEPVEIEKKFVNSYTIIPTCKHIIATNVLPAINDSTDATYNRLLIIEFTKVIPPDKQDKFLHDRLEEELPGIINWAMVGAKRLIESGGVFTEVSSTKKIIAQYKEDNDVIATFLDSQDYVVADPRGRMTTVRFAEIFNKIMPGRDMHSKRINSLLRKSGLQVERSNGKRWVVGLRHVNDVDSYEPDNVSEMWQGHPPAQDDPDDVDF